jgi:hypothetical protein
MLYLSQDFNRERPGMPSGHFPASGVLAALFKIAMSAVAWFVAVAWLNFEGTHVTSKLAVMSGIFVVSLTLLLVFGSQTRGGPRCRER